MFNQNWIMGKRFEGNEQRVRELVGLLPNFWSIEDGAKAKDQANENYAHGGGWFASKADWDLSTDREWLTLVDNSDSGENEYYSLVAKLFLPLTSEWVCIFTHAWVGIVQADGKFEIARMD